MLREQYHALFEKNRLEKLKEKRDEKQYDNESESDSEKEDHKVVSTLHPKTKGT